MVRVQAIQGAWAKSTTRRGERLGLIHRVGLRSVPTGSDSRALWRSADVSQYHQWPSPSSFGETLRFPAVQPFVGLTTPTGIRSLASSTGNARSLSDSAVQVVGVFKEALTVWGCRQVGEAFHVRRTGKSMIRERQGK